jgi:hypothetical protein
MRRRFLLLLGCASALGACSLLTSLDDLRAPATDGGADTLADSPVPLDALADAGEAGSDGDTDGGVDLSDLSRWSAFDLTTLGGAPTGLWGGTFDGRYVYLTPSAEEMVSSLMYRYDTTGSFTTPAGWLKFDTSSIGAGATDFAGAVFDGRFVYFAPTWGGTVTARFDTTGSFTQTSSWTLYDPGAAYTFRQGATFDGRYAYFVPTNDTVSQFDTTQSFTTMAAWTTVSVSTFTDAGPTDGFTGAVYDGRYVYIIPTTYPEFGNLTSGIVMRYDTHASFGAATSWSSFDTHRVSSAASGFVGAAFDGRFVYIVPYENDTNALDGVTVRYDTTAAFGSASSWEAFNMETLSTLATGFTGAIFDGRYVYYVPRQFGGDGLVVRYDTHTGFTLASSWTTFDTHDVNVNAGGFMGAIFDGEFVYFVPGPGHLIVRFDTGTRIQPPENGGSFF